MTPRDGLAVHLLLEENARLCEALRYHRQGMMNILEFRKSGDRYGLLTRDEIEESIAKMDAALEAGS